VHGFVLKILLTNDDGPLAPGLHALQAALLRHGDVTLVCPAEERSGVSHSITYLTPVRVGRVDLPGGASACTVTGNPADCVKFALCHLLAEPPDLIVSGPNLGVNVGWDVFYSGTVAAALEGGMNGVASVAVSTSRQNSDKMDVVARHAARVILALPRTAGAVYNVNIPALKGGALPAVRATRQCRIGPPGTCVRQDGPRGRTHYWLGVAEWAVPPGPDTDVGALAEGCVSITPLRTDLTDASALERLAGVTREMTRDEGLEDEQ
jgi:5'-nucleotidase